MPAEQGGDRGIDIIGVGGRVGHRDADGGLPAPDPLDGGDLPTRMLVFGVAHHDGTISASDAFAVAEACGRSAEQVRSCLRRLVSEGLFGRDGVGQRAVYTPTDAGLRELSAMGSRACVRTASSEAFPHSPHEDVV